jgi:glutamate carboxypeptidase
MREPVPAEAEMLDWLAASQPAMERLLSKLVDIDGPSNYNAGLDAVADELATFLDENNVPTRRLAAVSGATILKAAVEATDTAAPVLLLGHMDTVFPRGTAAQRPFSKTAGRLYGPGVADMKAGLVMNVFVLAGAARFGVGARRIEGLFTVDEEVASPISRPFIQDAARRASMVLNAEPGRANGNVVIERKGGIFLRIRVAGKPAHSGVDFEGGASAISELAHKIVALEQLTDIAEGITVNVGLISGGQSVNTVAPNAEAGLDVRYARNAQRDILNDQLCGIVNATTTPGTSSTLEIMGEFQPMVPDDEARRLFATYRDAAASLGIEVDAEATGGCSDAGFTASLGIPTLCGVGPVGGNAHTEDEYVERDSLVTRAQALALTISRHRPTRPGEVAAADQPSLQDQW